VKRRFVWVIVFTALILGGGAAWWFTREEEKPEVKTAIVRRGDLEVIAAASGRVEADVQVEVKSRASGEVIDILIQAGDVVRAGDLLVRLDPADEERRLREAEAEVMTARARLAQAQSALAASRADLLEEQGRLARRQSAYRGGLVSGEELQAVKTSAEVAREAVAQREADVSSAQAAVSQAALAIEEARKRLSETIIRSVVNGTVLQVAVERGTIVASGISNVGGGTTLLTVADLSKLQVIVKLDEAGIGAVAAGQDVRIRVDAFPDRVFSGLVERITPLGVSEANIVTFDVNVRITDRAAHLLLPGMSTDVEIVTALHDDVLLIPSAALRRAPRARNGNGAGAGSDARSVDSAETAQDAARERSTADTSSASRATPWSANAGRETGVFGGREEWLRRAGGEGETERWRRRAGGDTEADLRDRRTRDTRTAERYAPFPTMRPTAPERPVRRASVQLVTGEERAIRVGATDGIQIVVLEGISEGDEVILGGSRDTGAQRPTNPFMMRGGRR
jgi:HlyD family secretion protein